MAISSASAVSAFSPPESSRTFCRRLPGGCAAISMPVSPELSASVRCISPVPPPNSVRKASAKLALMTAKATSNFRCDQFISGEQGDLLRDQVLGMKIQFGERGLAQVVALGVIARPVDLVPAA